jgi:asparagine synthase (glutamine-hydrolysing)
MCGLAAVVFKNKEIQTFTNSPVLQSLKLRGPDGQRVFDSDSYTFFHSRLSINGLGEFGDQPIVSSDGRWTVIFNGEIYNFKELKDQLGLQNINSSDGMVIPEILSKFGIKGLSYLSGMYSIIAFDNTANILVLAVDPFGIKPLYFLRNKGMYYIASEPKVFSKFGFQLEPDEKAFYQFLSRGSLPNHISGYTGITKVQNNTCISISSSGEEVYSIIKESKHIKATKNWKDFIVEFENSVQSHTVSELPLGLLLSDGVDSTAIAEVLIKKEIDFTAVNVSVGGGRNESFFAEDYCRGKGVNFVLENIAPTDLDVQKFLGTMQRPTCDGLNTYLVSKKIREIGLKVALNGTGGDELFCGYPFHKKIGQLSAVYNGIGLNFIWQNDKYGAIDIIERARVLWKSKFIDKYLNVHLRGGDLNNITNHRRIPFNPNDITISEFNRYLIPELVQDLDTFSMANSIELRVPYITWDLLQCVLSIGNREIGKGQFVQNFNSEALNKCIDRPKQGFKLPMYQWLYSGPMRSMLDGLFHHDSKFRNFLTIDLEYKKNLNILENRERILRKFGARRIWSLIVFENWFRPDF